MKNENFTRLSVQDKEDILQQIQIAVQNGYQENVYFLNRDNFLQSTIREYLLTVNVAQQLHRWIIEKKFYFLQVWLECSAQKFKNAAFPDYRLEMKDNSILELDIVSATPNSINRKGFIDIALFEDGPKGLHTGPRSCMGIELKAINPRLSLVREDVDRLVEVMNNRDLVGINSIQQSVVIYLQRLDMEDRPFHENEIQPAQIKHLDCLKSALASVQRGGLSIEYRTHTIVQHTAEEYLQRINPEEGDYPDYSEAASESGTVIAVMILIARESAPAGTTR